ncbi:MAG: putative manganese transporter [Bacteroides sp.]|nr:putative manganese transporter [Bacteroides sp.]
MDWMQPLWETIHIVFFVMVVLMLMEFIELYRMGKGGGVLFLGDRHPFVQLLVAALLGFIPGCVGGLMVVSLYAHRAIGFGAVVAAFTALGDDAFRMLAIEPEVTVWVELSLLLLGMGVGTVCNRFAKPAPQGDRFPCKVELHKEKGEDVRLSCFEKGTWGWRKFACLFKNWSFAKTLLVVLLVGYLVVIFGRLHSPLDFEHIVFAVLTVLALAMVLVANEHFLQEHLYHHLIKKHLPSIFLWTLGTLCFLAVFQQSVDLRAWIENDLGKQFLLPLAAVAIGWIPQSGPHFLFIQLYFTGVLPLGVFFANAIVQDGHTSLLLLSESRRKFVLLKTIKSVIALIIGIILLWAFAG